MTAAPNFGAGGLGGMQQGQAGPGQGVQGKQTGLGARPQNAAALNAAGRRKWGRSWGSPAFSQNQQLGGLFGGMPKPPRTGGIAGLPGQTPRRGAGRPQGGRGPDIGSPITSGTHMLHSQGRGMMSNFPTTTAGIRNSIGSTPLQNRRF